MHRPSFRTRSAALLLLTMLTLVSVGCGSDPDPGESATDAGLSPDMQTPPGDDAGNPMDIDAGNPMDIDAGNPMDIDAGNPMNIDAGNPMDIDAGNPMDVDAGSPMDVDAGSPMDVDAGPPPPPRTCMEAPALRGMSATTTSGWETRTLSCAPWMASGPTAWSALTVAPHTAAVVNFARTPFTPGRTWAVYAFDSCDASTCASGRQSLGFGDTATLVVVNDTDTPTERRIAVVARDGMELQHSLDESAVPLRGNGACESAATIAIGDARTETNYVGSTGSGTTPTCPDSSGFGHSLYNTAWFQTTVPPGTTVRVRANLLGAGSNPSVGLFETCGGSCVGTSGTFSSERTYTNSGSAPVDLRIAVGGVAIPTAFQLAITSL
jgi:hypothetical protein